MFPKNPCDEVGAMQRTQNNCPHLWIINVILSAKFHLPCKPSIRRFWGVIGRQSNVSNGVLYYYYHMLQHNNDILRTQTTTAPRNEGQSFDSILEILMWGRIFQECSLSGFDNSDIVGFIAPALRKSFQGLLTDQIHLSVLPETQTFGAELG